MRREEERARLVAGENLGLIDRPTALSLGVEDGIIKSRLRAGRWDRPHPGVYYMNVTDQDWRGRVRAALMAAGPAALATHRTAAVLWRLDGVGGSMIETTVPYSNQPVPSGVIVHRSRRVLDRDVVSSIPVTTVERTLLDLAAVLPGAVLEKSLMSAVRMRLTTPDDIGQVLTDQGGRGVRGTRKLRRTLGLTDDGITGSPAEVETMRLIRSAPIPLPRCQFEIRLPDGTRAFPDFAWPSRRRCIEVDGLDAHGSAQALHRDLERQNMLLELGWEVRRFSARAIRREPQRVLQDIVHFING